jgi:hypothetical protein
VISPTGVDVYAGDGPKDWIKFCAAGAPWHFAIFKCSQGTYYRPLEYGGERGAFLRAAGDRIGHDMFEGAYHYLDLGIDGTKQAEYAVRACGAPSGGTMPMMVDVERGGQRIKDPSSQLIVDRVIGFAAKYQQLTGRQATLYGGELLRSAGIKTRLGCGLSAVALYGAELHGTGESTAQFLARTGTDLEHLMLWQYRGTEPQTTGPVGYPMTAPGCGIVDISALTLPGGLDALRALCV